MSNFFYKEQKSCALTLIAICFLGMSDSSPAVVFGDDNIENGIEDQRRMAPHNLLSFSGTIHCGGRLRGSGSHIQLPTEYSSKMKSIILTAAHILYHPTTGAAYSDCSYRPQGKRLSNIAIDHFWQHNYDPLMSDSMKQADNDVVFAALKTGLSSSGVKLQTIGHKTQPLMLVGYNEKQQNISLSDGCHQFESRQFDSDNLLFHDCDADSGASGGAIIDPLTGALVAIHGGTLLLEDTSSELVGIRANAEVIINQGRKVDGELLNQLRQFIAYLATDFPD